MTITLTDRLRAAGFEATYDHLMGQHRGMKDTDGRIERDRGRIALAVNAHIDENKGVILSPTVIDSVEKFLEVDLSVLLTQNGKRNETVRANLRNTIGGRYISSRNNYFLPFGVIRTPFDEAIKSYLVSAGRLDSQDDLKIVGNGKKTHMAVFYKDPDELTKFLEPRLTREQVVYKFTE